MSRWPGIRGDPWRARRCTGRRARPRFASAGPTALLSTPFTLTALLSCTASLWWTMVARKSCGSRILATRSTVWQGRDRAPSRPSRRTGDPDRPRRQDEPGARRCPHLMPSTGTAFSDRPRSPWRSRFGGNGEIWSADGYTGLKSLVHRYASSGGYVCKRSMAAVTEQAASISRTTSISIGVEANRSSTSRTAATAGSRCSVLRERSGASLARTAFLARRTNGREPRHARRPRTSPRRVP